ncbi:hypothetical protein K1T71_002652 [Dendrolimus kikuchii]|uniref:Uncharacterized protein n=1 Tax=Dendrolimus kikuchii TaxID=765133 RepID=A0ACC1DDQ2_9NEOP|nr:hypothetical protein K1T71_002652 [Dendrolimus kikuchii]
MKFFTCKITFNNQDNNKNTKNKTLKETGDADLVRDSSTWQSWRPRLGWFWKTVSDIMLNKVFTRFPDMLLSESAGKHYQGGLPRRKLKNKVKILFKLQQFET